MSKDIKLSKNNDFFFDSIMSMRYLKPKLIDNDLFNKMKKQYNNPIDIKPLETIIENESNKIFILEKQDKWYNKLYNQMCDFICKNYHIIFILLFLLIFLYYRYMIFRSKSNDELLLDNIRREEKRKALLNKKILLEKLLKDSNKEVHNNNLMIYDNNIKINKNIDNELNINTTNTFGNNDIDKINSVDIFSDNKYRNNNNSFSIDNYLSSTNLMAHNDLNGNYDYI